MEEKEDIIKELQERIMHLEPEKNLKFVDLRHFASLVIFVGSFGQDKEMNTEEDIVEQHSHNRSVNPSLLSSFVGIKKTAHFGNGNKNV